MSQLSAAAFAGRMRWAFGGLAGIMAGLFACLLLLGAGVFPKPALLEALALNFADNTDAKMETMIEALNAGGENTGWLGFNRLLETNIRKTTEL